MMTKQYHRIRSMRKECAAEESHVTRSRTGSGSGSAAIAVAKLLMVAACTLAIAPSAAHAQEKSYPATPVAGNWVSDARMTATLAQTPASNYWWVGRMWGRIDETGKMEFRAANGCLISGLMAKREYGALTGMAEFKSCQAASMNRIYRIRAIGKAIEGGQGDMHLTFGASRNGGAIGLLDTWEVEGAFVRYQP